MLTFVLGVGQGSGRSNSECVCDRICRAGLSKSDGQWHKDGHSIGIKPSSTHVSVMDGVGGAGSSTMSCSGYSGLAGHGGGRTQVNKALHTCSNVRHFHHLVKIPSNSASCVHFD